MPLAKERRHWTWSEICINMTTSSSANPLAQRIHIPQSFCTMDAIHFHTHYTEVSITFDKTVVLAKTKFTSNAETVLTGFGGAVSS